ALGRVANAAAGTPGWAAFYAPYRSAIGREDEERFRMRARLADVGAFRVLARELLDEVIPWDPTSGGPFERWWRDVVAPHPEALEALRLELARALGESEDPSRELPCAVEVLARQPGTADPSPGLLAL